MRPRTVLITGFTGQDGTFLARELLDQGYKVLGLVRRISTEPPRRTRGKFDFCEELASGSLELVEGDLLSTHSLINIIAEHQPEEIYNLAAQSHVGISFSQPEFTIESNFMGVVNLITAIESMPAAYAERVRIYQASTSEMFGDYYKEDPDISMTEHTPFRPNSPYAIAKTAAQQFCKMKRQQGLYISCGILFNHESEIRGGNFVTQKIARYVGSFPQDPVVANENKTLEPLKLGNLDAMRDWGYAGDYVKAMALMLQQDKPDDYIVGTGESHSVREFVENAFAAIGEKITWEIPQVKAEIGTAPPAKDYEAGFIRGVKAVVVDPKFYRPNDVNFLNGDSSKIQSLGWEPKHHFEDLVKLMVYAARPHRTEHWTGQKVEKGIIK